MISFTAYLLVYVPEVLVTALALAALAVCCYSYIKFKDFPALGYLFPLAYLFLVHGWFVIANPDEIVRRLLDRFGLIFLIIDIIGWRVNFMRRQSVKKSKIGT